MSLTLAERPAAAPSRNIGIVIPKIEKLQQGVRLTPTEVKVLRKISLGHSSKEVADSLVCSKRTIDFHLGNIYKKLRVKNRVQALREATRLGLLPFEPSFATN